MKAVVYDGAVRVVNDYPMPVLKPGWAIVRVTRMGICRTDQELIQGYMQFRGVLGHEFVGVVSACDDAGWVGKRVVGEINAACGSCAWCRDGMGRHCPHRSVLGILNLDGCMAEYCTLPVVNLHEIPLALNDDRAVFIEPLSAALRIVDQIPFDGAERCVVLGDGKLGILCAWALTLVSSDVTLVGRHERKLQAARWEHVRTTSDLRDVPVGANVVVEATGSADGFQAALQVCRPLGYLVLKSTLASQSALNLAPVVVNEIQVIGSRCGRFAHGIDALLKHDFPVQRLIDATYPLSQAVEAFAHATRRGALKVTLSGVSP